jgi:hypothetical protein
VDRNFKFDWRSSKEERCKQDNLWVVSDSSLHGASGIVMLDPEPNERCQTAIIFGYGTLNLSRSKALKEAESNKGKQSKSFEQSYY